jgi:hypothetical protein
VKFIQVGYMVKKEGVPENFKKFAGQKRIFWVSSSADYVDMFTKYSPMWDRYPATKTAVAYLKPLDYYDPKPQDPKKKPVNGVPLRVVVTNKATEVLGEKLQPVAQVTARTLLGAFTGSLNTGSKKYVKFLTASSTERWVDANDIQILEQ